MRSAHSISRAQISCSSMPSVGWGFSQAMRRSLVCRATGPVLLALGATASPALAQCGPQWLPLDASSSFNHWVLSVGGWDSDGTGPASPVLVAGGLFTAVGSVPAQKVAMWDGVQWHALGGGLGAEGGEVLDIVSHPDGRLIAGGSFIFSGPSPIQCCVAAWDGNSWQPVGGGVNNTVSEVDVLSSGSILVGGQFTTAGGGTARRIVEWNGSAWSEIGGGISSGSVEAMGILANGDVAVGGSFPGRLQAWDGTAWYNFDGTPPNGVVQFIAPTPDGGFDVSGHFTTVASIGVNYFARYDGSDWSACGNGFNSATRCSVLMPNGDAVVGGSFGPLPGGPSTTGIVRWNGSNWSALGSGMNGSVTALHLTSSGELVAVGTFTTAGGMPSQYFARWSETGVPWVAYQPVDQALEVGDDLVLSATPATAYSGVSYQWRKDGVDIIGASGLLISPTNGQAAQLVIEGLVPSDAGEYMVVFSNSCGAVASESVGVSVLGTCPADYNGAGDEGDVLDFLDFFDDFGACENQAAPCGSFGDADVNGDTSVDVLDFLDYLDAFGNGC